MGRRFSVAGPSKHAENKYTEKEVFVIFASIVRGAKTLKVIVTFTWTPPSPAACVAVSMLMLRNFSKNWNFVFPYDIEPS